MAAIRPSRTPMSAEYHGDPVPSTMWPFRMTMSNGRTAAVEAWVAAVSEAMASVIATVSETSFGIGSGPPIRGSCGNCV